MNGQVIELDMRQLKYFLTIAQEGQVTRAAKLLNMEQPPLSRQLKQMEEELGVKLFERNGKGLILTDSGELLKQKAESLLLQFDESLREVKGMEEGFAASCRSGLLFPAFPYCPKILSCSEKNILKLRLKYRRAITSILVNSWRSEP